MSCGLCGSSSRPLEIVGKQYKEFVQQLLMGIDSEPNSYNEELTKWLCKECQQDVMNCYHTANKDDKQKEQETNQNKSLNDVMLIEEISENCANDFIEIEEFYWENNLKETPNIKTEIPEELPAAAEYKCVNAEIPCIDQKKIEKTISPKSCWEDAFLKSLRDSKSLSCKQMLIINNSSHSHCNNNSSIQSNHMKYDNNELLQLGKHNGNALQHSNFKIKKENDSFFEDTLSHSMEKAGDLKCQRAKSKVSKKLFASSSFNSTELSFNDDGYRTECFSEHCENSSVAGDADNVQNSKIVSLQQMINEDAKKISYCENSTVNDEGYRTESTSEYSRDGNTSTAHCKASKYNEEIKRNKISKRIFVKDIRQLLNTSEIANNDEITTAANDNYSKFYKQIENYFICKLCSNPRKYRKKQAIEQHLRVAHEESLNVNSKDDCTKRACDDDDDAEVDLENENNVDLVDYIDDPLYKVKQSPRKSFSYANSFKKVGSHYICNICMTSRNYKNSTAVRQHIKIIHFGFRFMCTECNEKFTYTSAIKSHYQQCHNLIRTKFKKTICKDEHHKSRKVSQNTVLYSPNSYKQMGLNYICTLCTSNAQEFTNLKELRQHIKAKHLSSGKEEQHKPRKVSQNTVLYSPNSYKQMGLNYICTLCTSNAQEFTTLKQLRRHIKAKHLCSSDTAPSLPSEELNTTTADSHYRSRKQQFSYKNLINKLENNQYLCMLCPKSASYGSHVAASYHIKIKHFGYRYICKECGLKHTNTFALRQHYQQQHNATSDVGQASSFGDFKPILSNHCLSQISSNGQATSAPHRTQFCYKNLIKEVDNHYMCCICNNLRKYRNRATASYHIKIHHFGFRYECEKCDEKFTNTANLWRHVQNMHNSGRSNEICIKAEKLSFLKNSTLKQQHFFSETKTNSGKEDFLTKNSPRKQQNFNSVNKTKFEKEISLTTKSGKQLNSSSSKPADVSAANNLADFDNITLANRSQSEQTLCFDGRSNFVKSEKEEATITKETTSKVIHSSMAKSVADIESGTSTHTQKNQQLLCSTNRISFQKPIPNDSALINETSLCRNKPSTVTSSISPRRSIGDLALTLLNSNSSAASSPLSPISDQCENRLSFKKFYEKLMNQYKCRLCPNQYNNVVAVIHHIRNVHYNLRYTCTECNKQYSNLGMLKVHFKNIHATITARKIFKIIPKIERKGLDNVSGKTSKKQIEKITTEKKLFSKNANDAATQEPEESNRSNSSHSDTYNFRYRCRKCGLEYTTTEQLNEHKSKVHNSNRSAALTKAKDLKQQNNIISKSNKSQDKQISKESQDKQTPKESQDKDCNQSSSGNSTTLKPLLKYKNMYTIKGNYYLCIICTSKRRTFCSRLTLMKHLKLQHLGYRYKCSKCERKYSKPSCLRLHMQREHKESTKASAPFMCYTKMYKQLGRRNHFICLLCKKSQKYCNRIAVRQHIKQKHFGQTSGEKYKSRLKLQKYSEADKYGDEDNKKTTSPLKRCSSSGHQTNSYNHKKISKTPRFSYTSSYKIVDNNYICTLCSKSKKFKNLATIRQHIKITHFGVRYLCTECGIKYASWTFMQKHYKEVHNIYKLSFETILTE